MPKSNYKSHQGFTTTQPLEEPKPKKRNDPWLGKFIGKMVVGFIFGLVIGVVICMAMILILLIASAAMTTPVGAPPALFVMVFGTIGLAVLGKTSATGSALGMACLVGLGVEAGCITLGMGFITSFIETINFVMTRLFSKNPSPDTEEYESESEEEIPEVNSHNEGSLSEEFIIPPMRMASDDVRLSVSRETFFNHGLSHDDIQNMETIIQYLHAEVKFSSDEINMLRHQDAHVIRKFLVENEELRSALMQEIGEMNQRSPRMNAV